MESVRWLSTSRAELLRNHVGKCLATWGRDWWKDLTPEVACSLPVFDKLTSGQGTWFWTGDGGKLIAVGLMNATLGKLGSTLAGVYSEDEKTLAIRLAKAALSDLLWCLLGTDSKPRIKSGHELATYECFRLDRGAAAYAVGIGNTSYLISLNRLLVDRLIPREKEDSISLVRREDALGDRSINLEVRLSMGEINISELQDLRIGEIIVSNVPLNTPFVLSVTGQKRIADVRLGKIDSTRAIELLAPTHPIGVES